MLNHSRTNDAAKPLRTLQSLDAPRNLYEIHRDRRFIDEETTLWVGTERRTVKRPKFKSNLPKPDVERFWALSTLILDLGQQHISAAYCTGEYWRSTDAEAVRILAE